MKTVTRARMKLPHGLTMGFIGRWVVFWAGDKTLEVEYTPLLRSGLLVL